MDSASPSYALWRANYAALYAQRSGRVSLDLSMLGLYSMKFDAFGLQ